MGFYSQLSQDLEIEQQIIEQIRTVQDEIDDERAKGIIRQILGMNSLKLSKNQQHIFDTLIEPHLASRFVVCQRCSQTVDTDYASDISGEGDYVCDDCTENYMAE